MAYLGELRFCCDGPHSLAFGDGVLVNAYVLDTDLAPSITSSQVAQLGASCGGT